MKEDNEMKEIYLILGLILGFVIGGFAGYEYGWHKAKEESIIRINLGGK